MIGLSGVVVDPYDDAFESLGTLFNEREMPNFIKEAEIMGSDEVNCLPDHAFAVVVLGQGEPLRKYACTDKAHTAVNVMYLLQNADDIHGTIKTKAASNLMRACHHFGLESPAQLTKMAQGGKVLIKGDGAEMVVPGGAGEKTSEVVGTSVMPVTRPGKKIKLANIMESPYVEVVDRELKVKIASTNQATSLFNGELSLKPYDNVVKARDYFEEQNKYMHPSERREYCVKLAARAEQLGIPVSDTVRKYGATTYGTIDGMKVAFEQRSQLWSSLGDQAGDSAAMQLLEKRASIAPDSFAIELAELDIKTGIDQYWDGAITDPWLSTLGFEKKAEWKWHQGGEYLTENALRRFAAEGGDVVRSSFGEELAKGLAKNPTEIFDSLPLEQKRVIARMAQQQDSGL